MGFARAKGTRARREQARESGDSPMWRPGRAHSVAAMPSLPRILAAATAMLALSASTAIAGPPHEVNVHVEDQLSTVEQPAGTGSGWSRLTITANHRVSIGILRNKPNTDTGVLANTIGDIPVSKYERFGTWVARGMVAPGKPYVTTIDTLGGRRYTIVAFGDATVEDGLANNDTYGTGDWLVMPNDMGGEPPATTASITMTDKGIKATGLTAGTPVKVTNAGRRMHELKAYPMRNAAAAKQALKLARRGLVRQVKTAGAPVEIMGLVDGKTTQYLEPNLEAGTYLLVCGEGDRRKPLESHAAQGQAAIVTVG